MKNILLIVLSISIAFICSCAKEEEGIAPQPIVVTVKDTLKCYLSSEINYDTSQAINYVASRAYFTNNSGWYLYPPDSIFLNNIFLNYLTSSSSYPMRFFSFVNPTVSPVNVLDSLSWDCKGASTIPAFKKKKLRMPYLDYSYLSLDSLSISQNTVIQHPIINAKEVRYDIFYSDGISSPLHSHGISHYGTSSGFTIDTNELNYSVLPLNQFYFIIEMSVLDFRIDYPLDTLKITETAFTKISKKVYPKN